MSSFGRKTKSEEQAPASFASGAISSPSGGSAPLALKVKTADLIRDQVLLRIEPVAAVRMSKAELTSFVNNLVAEIANERKLRSIKPSRMR